MYTFLYPCIPVKDKHSKLWSRKPLFSALVLKDAFRKKHLPESSEIFSRIYKNYPNKKDVAAQEEHGLKPTYPASP